MSEPPETEPDPTPREVDTAILDLVAARGFGKTICPSEAARQLARRMSLHGGADWRSLMPAVRAAAARLAADQRIAVTQRGRQVDPLAAKGPIRLAPAEIDGNSKKD